METDDSIPKWSSRWSRLALSVSCSAEWSQFLCPSRVMRSHLTVGEDTHTHTQHTHTHTHTHAHTQTHTHTRKRAHTHTRIHTRARAQTQTRTHAHLGISSTLDSFMWISRVNRFKYNKNITFYMLSFFGKQVPLFTGVKYAYMILYNAL